jgi:hypothetical protein
MILWRLNLSIYVFIHIYLCLYVNIYICLNKCGFVNCYCLEKQVAIAFFLVFIKIKGYCEDFTLLEKETISPKF